MKFIKIFSRIALAVFIMVIITNCQKDNLASKTAGISVDFTSRKSVTLKSTENPNSILVSMAKISIANLVIEENSGNDVEQNGNNNDENKKSGKDDGKEGENEDLTLSGPFVFDISDGAVNIGNIPVFPGVYKKVNFTFLANTEQEFNGSSIIIKGVYTSADGTVTAFELNSEFSQQIQLPIANGGITVLADSTADLSIVLDIPGWLSALDFSSALETNGKILIDKNNNQNLLNSFTRNLELNIEVED